ncbi:MAG: flagellar assembly protein FliW [Spirochaetales bacterium]|nr:flagellar assembly protein FliW [Spirochaetales bacterium]
MEVNTKAYGKIDIDERQIITFPSGIPGFESLKKFALLDAAQQPFYWLQSLDVQEIAFVMISPLLFKPNYNVQLSEQELEELNLSEFPNEEALLFAIVTIPENQAKMTANLQGPVIINKHTKTGRQFIHSDVQWKTKHYILDELASVRNEAC